MEPEPNHVAELNAALAAAQGEFPPIPRDKHVKVRTRDGGTYEFAYAPLDSILAACRPALAKHGLAVTQLLDVGDNGTVLRTELRHQSGGLVGSSFPFRPPDSPQQLGSLLTYLRRYALTAILGVAAEEDDDGQQAADQPPGPQGPKMVTKAQHGKIAAVIKSLEETETPLPAELAHCDTWVDALKVRLLEQYGVESRKDLTSAQASELIDWLEAMAIPF